MNNLSTNCASAVIKEYEESVKTSNLVSKNVKNDYYVYLHKSKKDGSIFYVGKGRQARAKKTNGRTTLWKAAASEGYEIEYYAENLTQELALEIEKKLIQSLPNLINYHMSSPLDFTLRDYKEYFAINQNSPSFLDRIVKTWTGTSFKGTLGNTGYIDKRANKFYWRVKFKNKNVFVHRIVWTLANGEIPPFYVVDHIDGNGLNNRLDNLRLVRQEQNCRNKIKNKNNTSGVTGVHFEDANGVMSYRASVIFDDVRLQKRFSVKKYGKDEAFRLACEWRITQLNALNKQGAGYSDLHGQ